MGATLLALLAIVVLAEAINKLYHTRPCLPGITSHERLLEWLKAAAWMLLAVGAGGAVIGLIFQQFEPPPVREICTTAGFVVLIVRTRLKEG